MSIEIAALKPGHHAVLEQLFVSGPVPDGNLLDKEARSDLVKADLVVKATGWNALSPAGLAMAIEIGLGQRKTRIENERRSQSEQPAVPARGERVVSYDAHVAVRPEKAFAWSVLFKRDLMRADGQVVEQYGRIAWFEHNSRFFALEPDVWGLYEEHQVLKLLGALYASSARSGLMIGSAAPTIEALQAHARDLADIAKALAGKVPPGGADRR